MSNSIAESNTLVGRTCRNDCDGSTVLSSPKEFCKALGIENSKVSMSLLKDFGNNKYLLVSKYHNEIVID